MIISAKTNNDFCNSLKSPLVIVFHVMSNFSKYFGVEKFNRMLQNFPPKFIERTGRESCNFDRKLQQFHLHSFINAFAKHLFSIRLFAKISGCI